MEEKDTKENQESQDNQESQEAVESQVGFNLDYSVLEGRGHSSYMSLTDLYHISVFTDDFTERIKNYQNKESQKIDNLQQQVFVSESKGTIDTYDELISNMFIEEVILMPKEKNAASAKQDLIIYYMVGGIIFLLFFLVLIQYYTHKRKESLAHVNDPDDNIFQK